MNISKYIESKETLQNLHFATVYQTISTLIADGIISVDDLNQASTDAAESVSNIFIKEI
jgi:Fe2+ or Zn2+ uptake regulation protein